MIAHIFILCLTTISLHTFKILQFMIMRAEIFMISVLHAEAITLYITFNRFFVQPLPDYNQYILPLGYRL